MDIIKEITEILCKIDALDKKTSIILDLLDTVRDLEITALDEIADFSQTI